MRIPTVVSASAAATSGTGALSVAWPTHRYGDIGILYVESANETISTPSGWTLAATAQGTGTGGAAGSVALAVFWKRAASAAESNVTVADTGDHTIAAMVVVRGCDPVNSPINISAGGTATSSTSVSVPTVTTTTNYCLILASAAHATDTASAQFSAWADASLSSVAEVVDVSATDGVGGGIGVASGGLTTAGASGAVTATLATASAQALIMIALAPATGFFVMDGTVIPVQQGNAGGNIIRIGTSTRTFTGTLRSAIRAEKRVWKVVTLPIMDTPTASLKSAIANASHIYCWGNMIGTAVLCEVTLDDDKFISADGGDSLGFMHALSLTVQEV